MAGGTLSLTVVRHPTATAYRRMGKRFAARAFANGGPFSPNDQA